MKNITILFSLLLPVALCAQFDPLQTQYARNPLVINPACAGEQGFMSATLSARRQWIGFNGAPETYVFTMHTPVKSLNHNIGLLAAQDNIAVVHKTELSVNYAYRIVTPKYNFSAGIAPLIELISSNWNEVQTNIGSDPAFGYTQRFVRYGLSYGVYGNSNHFFLGVSHRFLNSEDAVLAPQPFVLFTGIRFGSDEKLRVTISSLGRMIDGKYAQADVNAFALYRNRIGAGLGYRWSDAVVGQLNIKVNEQFTVGYSYDYTISSLRNYSGGSHELLLRYDFGYTVNRPNPLYK